MVTLTDETYNALLREAREYRRLLVVCRERVVRETERAERAERTIEMLLADLKLREASTLEMMDASAC